jgi:hypothetical protein
MQVKVRQTPMEKGEWARPKMLGECVLLVTDMAGKTFKRAEGKARLLVETINFTRLRCGSDRDISFSSGLCHLTARSEVGGMRGIYNSVPLKTIATRIVSRSYH